MRHWILALSCVVTTGTASAQWVDSLWADTVDGYSNGDLTPQSPWELWSGSGGEAEARVVTKEAYSGSRSIRLKAENDVVWDFAVNPPSGGVMPTSGQWVLSAKTFMPTGVWGSAYLIGLSIYDEPNNATDWALELRFDANTDEVIYNGTPKASLPLVRDAWVSICVWIDLDRDLVDIWYGPDMLVDDASWINGTGAAGVPEFHALDLYGGNPGGGIKGGSFYLDDVRLESALGGSLVSETSPNPASEGVTATFQVSGMHLPGAVGVAFLTAADHVLLPEWMPLFFFGLDGTGHASVNTTVPVGLAGHSFQGRVFCADLAAGSPAPHSLGNTWSIEVR